MRNDPLFHLPPPLPQGAAFLGPADWLDAGQLADHGCVSHEDPAAALAWLRESVADVADAPARLVIIHQDLFAGSNGADRLGRWLDDVRALHAPLLPVLLHGNLAADPLVRFFRAGLFDALTVPVDRAAWVNLLIRAERRLELRQQSRLILESSGRTRETLHRLRNELDEADLEDAAGLQSADESLEAANRQLTDAMGELSLLYRFGRELSTARNWDRVLREILRNLGDFVGAGGAALILRSAPGGSYSPRQTWRWDETAWDKVLVNLNDQVDAAVAESIMAPGVFRIEPGQAPGFRGRRIIALPLEHHAVRLGYLLLLFSDPAEREAVSRRYLPFLQAVQVMLSEEVASAQMLDRVRDIGAFNARVLETVSSAIWVVAENGSTVYCNRAGQRMLTGQAPTAAEAERFVFEIGRGRDDPSGQKITGLVPEIFLDGKLLLDEVTGPPLARLRDAAKGEFRGEGRVLRSDGTGIPVLVQTSVMPGRQRDETWLVVVAEDLRASRKLEAERLRSERLEGLVEMSATLAHEIRNPLMGLSAQAELLAERMPPDDRRGRYVEVITAEVDRINATITRMLNFVRPYEPEMAPGSLWRLAEDAVALAEPRAAARGIVLQGPQASPPNPMLYDLTADAVQLKQVLLNLLFNGVDAAPAGGRVELVLSAYDTIEVPAAEPGTSRSCPGLGIEVIDDGPGIRPEDLARIFRPFFTTKAAGTGLGLPLCHKIVAAHGGDIQVSRRDDRTVFRVLLPRIATAKQKAEEAS